MLRRKMGVAALGLGLALSGLVGVGAGAVTTVAAPAAPAQAATVHNMYECHPSTGWCYQTNPPYNPAFKRACRWNYTIPWLTSGMWYTGCTQGYWRPEVH